MKLTTAGFAEIMDICVGLASGSAKGRVVAVLEGGYSLQGLASSTAASVARLLDRPSPPLRPAVDLRTDKLLDAYRQTQAPLWSVVAWRLTGRSGERQACNSECVPPAPSEESVRR